MSATARVKSGLIQRAEKAERMEQLLTEQLFTIKAKARRVIAEADAAEIFLPAHLFNAINELRRLT